MHLCPSAMGTILCSCRSYSHSSPMPNTVATARTGREHNGRWKTIGTPLGQPMMLPTARWPTNTLSHGSSWPSRLRTIVPRLVAHDCADTSPAPGSVAKSWATQDLIHLLKTCAAAAIYWGNMGIASPCVMYDLDTSNACSGARYKAAGRPPGRPSKGFHGGRF